MNSKTKHNEVQINYYSAGIKSTMIPEASPYLLKQIDELVSFADIKPQDKVLEVGCGMGRYTLNMAERGIDIEGLDLTRFLLDKLDEYNNGRYNIPLHHTDIINAPKELNEKFDKIIGFFAMHHFHDIEACYKAMARLLKPGGTITFLEPNAFNPLYYLQMIIKPNMTWEGDKGITKMRKGLIFKAMKNAGLKNPKVARFGFLPPLLYNMKGGALADTVFAGFPLWKPLLPFQLFKGTK